MAFFIGRQSFVAECLEHPPQVGEMAVPGGAEGQDVVYIGDRTVSHPRMAWSITWWNKAAAS